MGDEVIAQDAETVFVAIHVEVARNERIRKSRKEGGGRTSDFGRCRAEQSSKRRTVGDIA